MISFLLINCLVKNFLKNRLSGRNFPFSVELREMNETCEQITARACRPVAEGDAAFPWPSEHRRITAAWDMPRDD